MPTSPGSPASPCRRTHRHEDRQPWWSSTQVLCTPRCPRPPQEGLQGSFPTSHQTRKSSSHWAKPVAKLGGVLAPTAQGRKTPLWASRVTTRLCLPGPLKTHLLCPYLLSSHPRRPFRSIWTFPSLKTNRPYQQQGIALTQEASAPECGWQGLGGPSTPRPHRQRNHLQLLKPLAPASLFLLFLQVLLGAPLKVSHQQNCCTGSYRWGANG